VRPNVGWQLDPFGYSAVTPTLLEEYGFDSLFITRVGTQTKEELIDDGHLRFIWKGHDNSKGIFVTVL
jgi:epididymis-specific alpha-mannosidase